ncbi:Glyoxalase-like domain-containing protein [Cladophialophora immunda]|nr:Glyoxalase-like domain-containing protein [Cladophialophora immunda]
MEASTYVHPCDNEAVERKLQAQETLGKMPHIQRAPPNRVVNHLGLAVPDCEAAVEWYTKVLGFRKLQENISIIDKAVNPEAAIFRIYGDKCKKLKLACLTTGNGVGLEIFEFIDPKMEYVSQFEYTRGGFFHIAITDADPEALCAKVLEAGGSKIGDTVQPFAPAEDDEVVYFQDPWGNTIEVVSCSWEQLMGNRGGLEKMGQT